ncbi:MAG TPA: ABC transporter ATP-binding protein, partial [Rhabdochlamydiaceae bacterium]
VSLPWMLTAAQNLEVFARLYGIPIKEIHPRMDVLLERFGILDKKKHPIAQFSAGQITRLMLVKAFMVNPEIVLLDEPTASLDPDVAKEVCQFVLEQKEQRGTSILFTSHNMAEVAEVCDRVLFLQNGKIVANDIPENLARSVSTCRMQLLVGDGMKRTVAIADKLNLPYKMELRSIEFSLDETQIAIFLTALAHAGVVYTNINIIQPTLEDYFLKMVESGRAEVTS